MKITTGIILLFGGLMGLWAPKDAPPVPEPAAKVVATETGTNSYYIDSLEELEVSGLLPPLGMTVDVDLAQTNNGNASVPYQSAFRLRMHQPGMVVIDWDDPAGNSYEVYNITWSTIKFGTTVYQIDISHDYPTSPANMTPNIKMYFCGADLEHIAGYYKNATGADFSQVTEVRVIGFGECHFTSLDLSNNSNLHEVRMPKNDIAGVVDFSASAQTLQYVDLNFNEIGSIAPFDAVQGTNLMPNLTYFAVRHNQIGSIGSSHFHAEGCSALEQISLDYNQVTNLTLGNCQSSLTNLIISDNFNFEGNGGVMDLTGYNELEYFRFYRARELDKVILTCSTTLKVFDGWGNLYFDQLMDFSEYQVLEEIKLHDTDIKEIILPDLNLPGVTARLWNYDFYRCDLSQARVDYLVDYAWDNRCVPSSIGVASPLFSVWNQSSGASPTNTAKIVGGTCTTPSVCSTCTSLQAAGWTYPSNVVPNYY